MEYALQPRMEGSFDPLMEFAWYIYGRGLRAYGLMAMGHNPDPAYGDDGHFCPLCMARASFEHHNTPTGRCGDPKCDLQIQPGEEAWDTYTIRDTLDRMLKHCREEGLTAAVQ